MCCLFCVCLVGVDGSVWLPVIYVRMLRRRRRSLDGFDFFESSLDGRPIQDQRPTPQDRHSHETRQSSRQTPTATNRTVTHASQRASLTYSTSTPAPRTSPSPVHARVPPCEFAPPLDQPRRHAGASAAAAAGGRPAAAAGPTRRQPGGAASHAAASGTARKQPGAH